MADWTDGFDALIAPLSRQEFMNRHWERAPLHLRHGEAFVDGLLDLEDLDEVLTGGGLRHPTFRILMRGREAHPDTYTHRSLAWGTGQVAGYIDYHRALALIRDGGTVALEQFHRLWPPLARLTRSVELALGAKTQTNCYMTPAGNKGLIPHYDLQDVFVLQTVGTKRWWVHGPHVPLPVAGQDCGPEGVPPGELLLEIVLEPGDLLYLPRGFVHHAEALDQTSLHLSLSTVPTTWLDLLRDVVDGAREDVRLRRAVAVDLHNPNEATPEAAAELRQILEDLARNADLDELLDRTARRLISSRMPMMNGVLADWAKMDQLGLGSIVACREGMAWRVEARGSQVVLSFHGRQISLPWHALPTARFLAEAGPFTVRDLPGDLTDEQRLGLVRSLLHEGFLTFVS